MKSVSSRRKINVFLKQNNDFRQKSLKSLKNSMKSASSRRKINIFLKQNNDFRQKSLKTLKNSMKSVSYRRKTNVFIKQNNDLCQKSLKSLRNLMKSVNSRRKIDVLLAQMLLFVDPGLRWIGRYNYYHSFFLDYPESLPFYLHEVTYFYLASNLNWVKGALPP